MFSLLGTLFVGLIVGWLARAIKPGHDKLGLVMTSLLGVAGSFVASYAGVALGWYAQGQAAGWIASVIGAIALLYAVDFIKQKKKG
ncbi:MAG: GlsB/YeaQ/YmgE family stress response membrane protein [Comamonas sp.]|nr:GlsB/YeaQ/YmgE family stress response membrane protein [Comamonas sp.]